LLLLQKFGQQKDEVPPGMLYLAVRAARRALGANPDDAQTYLILGESYLRLLHSTRERLWCEQFPELLQLRRSQACAALNQALTLKPNLAQAHLSLGGLYREMGYLDLALTHLQTYFHLAQETGPPPGVAAEDFRVQAAQFQENLSHLAQAVEEREKAYQDEAANFLLGDRAALALQKGLAGKARDMLLESHISAFGNQGLALEVELLLRTGRSQDVLEWVEPEYKSPRYLGANFYHMLRIQALAANGDYGLAREECTQLTRALASGEEGREPIQVALAMKLIIAKEVLNEAPGGGFVSYLLRRSLGWLRCQNRLAILTMTLKQMADATVLWGLLALEEGETEEAAAAFKGVLAHWGDKNKASSERGLDFNGRQTAQEYLELLK
jgi:hypothetical protein